MKLKLDYHSSEPLYLQVVLQIKRLVVTHRLKPGDKLPSVRGLSQELGLNPTTIRRIFTQLASEGVVVQRPGLGVFVSENEIPFSPQFINKTLASQGLSFLIEGLRFGLGYPEILSILDGQYNTLKQEGAT